MALTALEERVAAEAAGRTALVLGFQNALALGPDPSALDELHAANLRLTAPADPDVRKVFIVQLRTPSAAEAFATATGAAQKTATGSISRARFDKTTAFVQNHAAKIAAEQGSVLAKAGAGTEMVYSYRYGMNGFAALMTEPQATKLARLPEVLQVWEDEIRPLATNFSPDYLELFDGEITEVRDKVKDPAGKQS